MHRFRSAFFALERRLALDGAPDPTPGAPPADVSYAPDDATDCSDRAPITMDQQAGPPVVATPAPVAGPGPTFVDTILDTLFPEPTSPPIVQGPAPVDPTSDPNYFPDGPAAFAPDPSQPIPVGPVSAY